MFSVPEPSRLKANDPIAGPYGSDASFGNNGVFVLQSPNPGWSLLAIASDGDGWEHVSVHAFRWGRKGVGVTMARQDRTPTWQEMMFIKRVFWSSEDAAMQLAPPEYDYVNCHRYTLHWWRPIGIEIPLPPTSMVGPKIEILT